MKKNFALIGVGGYIAPRHLGAIRHVKGNLLAAVDPKDSVGIMDSYFPQSEFFTEFERFDRCLDQLRRAGTPIDYTSICSPNYLHDAHSRFALRSGSHAICEKPITLTTDSIDELAELERQTGKQVSTILQLRLHDAIRALRDRVAAQPGKRFAVDLTYITSRGRWYFESWKGDEHKSGGIATNIGVHFFDMLTFVFGKARLNEAHLREPARPPAISNASGRTCAGSCRSTPPIFPRASIRPSGLSAPSRWTAPRSSSPKDSPSCTTAPTRRSWRAAAIRLRMSAPRSRSSRNCALRP